MLKKIVKVILVFTFIIPSFAMEIVYNTNSSSSNANNWPMFQSNSANNGYIPITLNPKLFKLAWNKKVIYSEQGSMFLTPAAVVGKNLLLMDYFVGGPDWKSSCHIFNLDSNTGDLIWQTQIPTVTGYLGEPVYDNNKVFVSEYASDGNNYLLTFNMSNGALLKQTQLAVTSMSVYQNMIYAVTNGSLLSINESNSIVKWQNNNSNLMLTPPVINKNILYTGYASYNINDGSIINTLPMSSPGAYFMALDTVNQNLILTNTESLSVVDVQKNSIRYSINQMYIGQPVVANNIIYFSGTDSDGTPDVNAIDEESGKTLWSMTVPIMDSDGIFENPILTNNLLFIVGSAHTFAIDLQTHQIVWSYPVVGSLALAQNHLYIVTGDTVYAISLS